MEQPVNPINTRPPDTSRKFLIIFGISLLAFIILAIGVASLFHSNKPSTNGSHLDANSGQTVSNPNGKVPEIRSGGADQPLYLGFGTLYDRGLTTYQLDDTKVAFATYSRSTTPVTTQVSISVDSIVHNLPDDSGNESLTFNVVLNDKTTYAARVDMLSLTAINLTLTDPKTHKTVFNSGSVDTTPGD